MHHHPHDDNAWSFIVILFLLMGNHVARDSHFPITLIESYLLYPLPCSRSVTSFARLERSDPLPPMLNSAGAPLVNDGFE